MSTADTERGKHPVNYPKLGLLIFAGGIRVLASLAGFPEPDKFFEIFASSPKPKVFCQSGHYESILQEYTVTANTGTTTFSRTLTSDDLRKLNRPGFRAFLLCVVYDGFLDDTTREAIYSSVFGPRAPTARLLGFPDSLVSIRVTALNRKTGESTFDGDTMLSNGQMAP